jgi:hypothetical protein
MGILDLLFLDNVGSRGLLDLVEFIPLGTFGLLFFGFPILLVSSLLALALSRLCRRLPLWLPMTIGVVLGPCVVSMIFSESFERIWTYLVSAALAGATCGWIYWRIAIGRTPPNGHAIEAE